MKYVDKNFVANQEGTKFADIVAKPSFNKKDKIELGCGAIMIISGIYTIAKKFFKAGCIGYSIGEYEALEEIGVIDTSRDEEAKEIFKGK